MIGRNYEYADSVCVDVKKCVYLAVHEMIQTGHKKICYINIPQAIRSHKERLEGAEKAIAESSVCLEKYILYPQHNTGEGGYQAIKELIESGERPDAIVAANDSLALGVMRYLYKQKIRIPDDISLISCEDSILSGYAAPALSTVNIEKELIGEEASHILLNRMARPKAKQVSMLITPRLVKRDTIQKR